MKKLTIFDNNELAGTITQVDNGKIYIFARSQISWRELNRLVYFGYKVSTDHPNFLEHVAKQAHEFSFNTELT